MIERIRMPEVATLLLTAGDNFIRVYGDASYLADVAVGAWAYQIPTFGIRAVGLEADTWVERLELLAVVKGMEAVATVDASGRGIHVHSDSDFVLSAMHYLSNLQDLPSRRSFDRVRDLFLLASTALGSRQLKPFKIKGKPGDHQACHLEARRHLRKHVWDDVRLSGCAALKRSEQILVARQRDCDRLEQQMEKAKRELSIAEVAVRALRQFNEA